MIREMPIVNLLYIFDDQARKYKYSLLKLINWLKIIGGTEINFLGAKSKITSTSIQLLHPHFYKIGRAIESVGGWPKFP